MNLNGRMLFTVAATAMLTVVTSVCAEESEERLRTGIAKCLSFGEIKSVRGEDGTAYLEVGYDLDFSKERAIERELTKLSDTRRRSYYIHERWVARTKDKDRTVREFRQGTCTVLLPGSFRGKSSCSFERLFDGMGSDEVTWTFAIDFHITAEASGLLPGDPVPEPVWITGAQGLAARDVRIARTRKGDTFEYVVHVSDAKGDTKSSASGNGKTDSR